MLNSLDLAAITEEARNCFLEEDAPEYLSILTKGIFQLKQLLNSEKYSDKLSSLYKELGRAAHSIKGGAGMAEMFIVSKLSHKIEDIFEALQQDRITDLDTSLELLNLSIDELENLINLEKNGTVIDDKNIELITILDQFIATINYQEGLIDIGFVDKNFIKTALTEDLSACIERVSEIIDNPVSATEKNITDNLNILIEECQLLGQALNCNWLVDISQAIGDLKATNTQPIKDFALLAIAEIEYHQKQYLEEDFNNKPEFSTTFKQLLNIEKKEEEKLAQKTTIEEKTLSLSTTNRNLRVPIQKINIMGDVVGELLIFYERLTLYENQLKQASGNLKKKTKLLPSIKEQIESIYDQLTINKSNKHDIIINENNSNSSEFDSLEFDEYNQVHNALQKLTELIIQVQEVREDFDLVNREFQETLIEMRKSIDILDKELRQVRLVPFVNLAGSFIKPLEKLAKTYHKSVELIIEGKHILMDQNIVETLRTPFNHIIRNAFDHGIETTEERQILGKPLPAKITLKTKIEGNNVILIIADDGKGIDVKKVYQKALDLGLFSQDKEYHNLSREKILGTIFSPGFSTATQVSDLSGRGMGMDIVKGEIEKLRGTIDVTTEEEKGTEFKLKIPMALSLISLLLIQVSNKLLAIPSENVLRIIRLSDYKIENKYLTLENKQIPIYNLAQILPYNQNISKSINSAYIGLLFNISGTEIIITVDAIVDEKPLVTKSFDDTVIIPPYLGGCTILGTGTVVPILVPDYLKPLLKNNSQKSENKNLNKGNNKKNKISVLVIDDSVTVRRSLNRVLTQVGYEVTQCRDGKEAWNTLQNTNIDFDLAVCDLEMPGFDGYKVLQLIRVSEKWRNLPVIILTSRDNDLHRQKAIDLGANAYVTKPFNPINFLEKITNFLK
jgi:chemotaxis protein histidine kinase CheA/CheY-like chemotaxis protein